MIGLIGLIGLIGNIFSFAALAFLAVHFYVDSNYDASIGYAAATWFSFLTLLTRG